jgi:ABC-type hemin transport system ATPase subunit
VAKLAQIWQDEDDAATRYLLLDEPTNNLDISHQPSVLKIARQFAGRCVAEGVPSRVITPEIVRSTFDLRVMVQAHPCYDCPLVSPMPDAPAFQPTQLEILDRQFN